MSSTQKTRGLILVVDDEANTRSGLKTLLEDEGFEVLVAEDGKAALQCLAEAPIDVVVTDLKMPVIDGFELLRRTKESYASLPVVMMTAFGDVESAVRAMQGGARHYLLKPIQIDELIVVLEHCLEHSNVVRQVQELRAQLKDKVRPSNMIGDSPAIQDVYKIIAQVAPTRANVLLTGESGTGKELAAQAIHDASPRTKAPFVRLHCAALAESVLESELFGHEKGSFTGAVARREGRFKQADGGTLFLDEVGEIPPSLQVKLLRFLQERTFERVGGNETLHVDVRIIAATNRDLEHEVREGNFREDLYYRLNVVAIEMPPLRIRGSDVIAVAEYFLAKYTKENNKDIKGFAPDAMSLISQYTWPGNVRELENAVERCVVMCQGDKIIADNLPTVLQTPRQGPVRIPGSTFSEIERHAILSTLSAVGGSTTKAARILDISVRTIQYRLHEYGLAKGPGGKGKDSKPTSKP
jgi:two-component system, NtrC family, response regulator HydG